MEASASDEVLVRREGRAGRITMNRPKALNALTHGMVGRIWEALLAWQDDPAVELVLLDGTGDRALCAGGDVRSLYDSRHQGSATARGFWRDEYRLNALIGRYPKPYVAIQDGIVMGGGIGLSAHARHRIVTERSRLAMPETGIGLIPDVGGTWLLAHVPGEAGIYLGLTGETMGAADAIYARFADAFVPAGTLDALRDRLIDAKGGAVADVIAAFAQAPGASALQERRGDIDRAFGSGNRRSHRRAAFGRSRCVGARIARDACSEVAEVPRAHARRHPQRPPARFARAGAGDRVPPVRAAVRGRRVSRGRARADRRQGPQAQVVTGASRGRLGGAGGALSGAAAGRRRPDVRGRPSK